MTADFGSMCGQTLQMAVWCSRGPEVLEDDESNHGRLDDLLPAWKLVTRLCQMTSEVVWLNFLAVARLSGLARWDKGDCHTPAATKSLVSAAPDPTFRCRLSAPTKEFCYCFGLQTVVGLAAH